LQERLTGLRAMMGGDRPVRPGDLAPAARWAIRTAVLTIDSDLAELASDPALGLSPADLGLVKEARGRLRSLTDYAPTWVTAAVACALGLGTMVGWKRIVVTVGEKIGKAHLTYAQGAAAELVAMTTIGLADFGGLPVSTTHVLSSGVAGTMAANGSGIQGKTVRSIALAWVLTLPVTMALAAGLYLALRMIFR
jgi:PiT family inorganic phosphate transporter